MKQFSYLLFGLVLLLHCSINQALAAECEHNGFNLAAEAIPTYSVSYQNNYAPPWKANWDQGRKLFRQKKYQQAKKQYELLLRQKKNIAQARWEYVFILMQQKQWREAEHELALLLAKDPQRPDYLLAKAEITLKSGELNLAAEIFSQLYQQQRRINTCQEDLIEILSGYIITLEKLKRFETLLPLMEELKILQPPGYHLHKTATTIAMENKGSLEKKNN
ncbi:MAG: tetratricopeptide repeat protein [Candidatus Electrothrix sp. AR3]|nr:tetratricopeptide repeat protein [Candidatus Electrothrix sp. AR3]